MTRSGLEIHELRDGRVVRLGPIVPDHAGVYRAYMLEISEETPWSGTAPEEIRSEEDQRKRFEESAQDGRTWRVGVFENDSDRMIGDCSWTRPEHVKFAHVASLGIGLVDGWRGAGLGRMLMDRAIVAAREDERVHKIELGVFGKNEIARNLYLSLGFVEEGCRRRGVLQLDGTYEDDIVMGLWVRD